MRSASLPPQRQHAIDTQANWGMQRRSILLSSSLWFPALIDGSLPRRAGAVPAPTSDAQTPALYDNYAQSYDVLDDGTAASMFGFPKLRQRMLSAAKGRVLECGAGTGINLSFYDRSKVQELVMLDLSQGMLNEAQQKAAATLATFVQGDVQQLPFPDGSFDTVVDTFSLCVYPDASQATREMLRVLKPGGQMLLLEHSRSPNGALGWYQDVTSEPVKALGKSCTWNQRVVEMVKKLGVEIVDAEYSALGTVVTVCARKPGGVQT